ncbi:MAG: acyl-CoA thioester hydrolase/BAAT C-terminal domain-containing protein, partial [Gemmatimonadota bacterium]
GGDDQMGPACENADRIARRLAEHGHPHPVVNLCYPGAGHAIALPYLPTSPVGQGPFLLGGTAPENVRANADSWPRVLAFLGEALLGRQESNLQPPR